MGYPSVGDGLPRDLFRTLAALAKGKSGINDPGYSALSSRDVSAQVPPFQIDVHVRGGEIDQRRHRMGMDRSFLSLGRINRA